MTRVLPALALALLLGACGGDESQSTAPPPAAAPVPAPAAETPAGSTEPMPAPTRPPPPEAPPAVPADDVPSGNLRGSPEAGAALYRQYCATCHGAGGKGDGPVAATLDPRPANHADHVTMAKLSDAHLYRVIKKGGAAIGKSPMMAPWGGVINDQGIRDLIAFLRQLSST